MITIHELRIYKAPRGKRGAKRKSPKPAKPISIRITKHKTDIRQKHFPKASVSACMEENKRRLIYKKQIKMLNM